MTVISFPTEKVVQRSNEPIAYDTDNRLMRLYACTFKHADKVWALKIWAYHEEDAQERINSIAQTMTLDGQIVALGPIEFTI